MLFCSVLFNVFQVPEPQGQAEPCECEVSDQTLVSAIFTVVCVTGGVLAVLPLLSRASTWVSESKQVDSESMIFLEVAQAVVSPSPYNISQ